ncbi:MAG: hypothetical protein ABL919_08585 [Methylococcales bacterium]|nr:AlpA family phage regulatory protein [Methylococcaceae bacterium]
MSVKTANTQKKPRNKTTYIPAPLPVEGVVRLPSVLAVLGISKTSFHEGIKAGKYPPGKLLSQRCRVWPVTEIRTLLSDIQNG